MVLVAVFVVRGLFFLLLFFFFYLGFEGETPPPFPLFLFFPFFSPFPSFLTFTFSLHSFTFFSGKEGFVFSRWFPPRTLPPSFFLSPFKPYFFFISFLFFSFLFFTPKEKTKLFPFLFFSLLPAPTTLRPPPQDKSEREQTMVCHRKKRGRGGEKRKKGLHTNFQRRGKKKEKNNDVIIFRHQ